VCSSDLPVEGNHKVPESLHPYQFANANPHFYSDPTGLFSLTELVSVQGIQKTLNTLKTAAINEAKQTAQEKITNLLGDSLLDFLRPHFPNLLSEGPDFVKRMRLGTAWGNYLKTVICVATFGQGSFEVTVTRRGMPVNNGLSCRARYGTGINLPGASDKGVFRLDFVLGNESPMQPNGQPNKTWLVGEIKSRMLTLYREYYLNKKHGRDQFDAITNYARRNTYSRTALFLTFNRGLNRGEIKTLRRFMMKRAIRKGVFAPALPVF